MPNDIYTFVSILNVSHVREYPRGTSKILYTLSHGMLCILALKAKAPPDGSDFWLNVFHANSVDLVPISIGWIYGYDDSGRLNFREMTLVEATAQLAAEQEKRQRLASAITAMLIRSLTVQKASRFARSLAMHASTNYPGKSLTDNKSKSIEEIMIELGGFSSMSKQQIFEYIKVAACNQSCPPAAVLAITEEIQNLLTMRPSVWVSRELNVLETEEVRLRNDRFVMAAAGGDMNMFRKMLHEGVELTNLHSELKCTALHAAADFGKVNIVAEIIKTGMSLNVKDPRRGHTPLHFAAQSARSEVIELLLEHGADRLLTSSAGLKPFEVADKLGYFDCREMLKYLPPTVKTFEVKEWTMNSLTVEWQTPKIKDSIHSPIILFMVECVPVSSDLPIFHQTREFIQGNAFTFTKLLPHEVYSITLQTKSLSGWSILSKPLLHRTNAAVPDNLPTVEVLKISINGIWIKWEKPKRENGSPVHLYQIEVIDYKTHLENVKNLSTRIELEEKRHSATNEPVNFAQTVPVAQDSDAKKKLVDLKSIGSVDKWHRLLVHTHVDDRFRYLAGLEPYRPYILRVRARNEIGFSNWSPWAGPVAPDMGVKVVEYKPSTLSARIEWFRPILDEANGRHVECYELQVCLLKGPLITTIKVLRSKAFLQPKEVDENFTTAHLKELELKKQQAEKLEEEEKSKESSMPFEEAHVNEFVTVSQELTTESYEISMHAGAKYQCRVRPKIAGEEEFCPWEMSIMSESFSLSATLPDPPFGIIPAVHFTTIANNTAETVLPNSSAEIKVPDVDVPTAGAIADESISVITNTDIMPLKLDPQTKPPSDLVKEEKQIISNGKTSKAVSLSNTFVTHDSIVITWKNGNCHGLPVEEFEVQWAKVREYRHEDLALAKDARGQVHEKDDFEKSLSIFDDSSEPSRAESIKVELEGNTALQWVSSIQMNNKITSETRGKFLGPQSFKVFNLIPGSFYIFRMRQRNQLGWSKFSAASEMIQTFPAVPPSQPELVSSGATYIVIRWSEGSEGTVGFTNLDYDLQISTVDEATVPKSIDGQIDWENCPLNWQSADSARCNPNTKGSRKQTRIPTLLVFNTIMVRRLVPGCQYVVRVRVNTLYGWSTWSSQSNIMTTLH